MAATKKPIEAFDYCKEYLKKMPLEQVQAPLLDDVNKEIWMAAPWRWTIGAFANFDLIANTVDYTIGSMPTDFLYITKAVITDGTRTLELDTEPLLPATPVTRGSPTRIMFLAGSPNKFRIFPPMHTIAAGVTWTVIVHYKKIAPIITKRNSHTAGVLVMDDDWFWVYRNGVLYKSYQYGDDDRAGTCTFTTQGQAQYTGQLGVYKASIQQMKLSEPLPVFRPPTDPEKSTG